MKQFIGLFLILFLPLVLRAKHIVGGELYIEALKDKPGHVKIGMNQFWEDYNPFSGEADSFLQVHIFRKQNPIKMATYYLDRDAPPTLLPYDNEACARDKKLKTYLAQFYGVHTLDPAIYSDPSGYYIVWERCCRSNNITNLGNENGVGMIFYAEFPPLSQNGVFVANSTPTFTASRGNYICLNKVFTVSSAATDADGDELRYSLVTPFQGYTTITDPWDNNGMVRQSYPLVRWTPGYSATAAIPGNPALTINAKTGQLTVKATEVGYFLFTVQCEEYRGGKKIGSVRRDFILPVIDCSRTTPPIPEISVNGQPIQEAKLCEGTSLTLTTDPDPKWHYQWQRDGVNLTGSTTSALTVSTAGKYTVIKSFSVTCANDTISPVTQVSIVQKPTPKLVTLAADGVSTAKLPLCEGDFVLLSLSTVSPGLTYTWEADKVDVAINAPQYTTNKPGTYRLTVSPEGSDCAASDEIQLLFQPKPMAVITASALQFCAGDSVSVVATNDQPYQYRWDPVTANAQATQWVKQSGTVRVTITNAAGCSAISTPLSLTALERPQVAVDSIAPVCASTARFPLQGRPTNGLWSGPGVTGGQFDPRTAGVGLHPIRYTVRNAAGCQTTAVRWIETTPPLLLNGPLSYQVQRGDTTRLQLTPNISITRIEWQPSLYLDNPFQVAPLYQSGESQQYTVQAGTSAGCSASIEVSVTVVDRLYIPNAFSPNGDGVNDSWRILNLDAFPTSEVTVFNRWGELIYQSVGSYLNWDGTYKQQTVEPGVYTYLIRTAPAGHLYRGQLTVLR
ncbi:gliding motility-associated C-terminal domain-containing protein [uncultured Fibrella sp.]|uniref:gliding motility-associated C-terminal domain-containing protein n=1 Tax=uncultured Fibrella sp. TaxID=1284596 RepID=UPI0035CC21CB